jgi:hypothetical protein
MLESKMGSDTSSPMEVNTSQGDLAQGVNQCGPRKQPLQEANGQKEDTQKLFISPHKKMKKLPSYTIQLLCKLINVNNLLYTHANVMQQINNLSHGVFTITYATDIVFGFDPKNLNMF